MVLACKHIDGRHPFENDDEVAAFEAIAAELNDASDAERNCLVEAAKKLGVDSWAEEMGII
ncbi:MULTISPECIES: hypothetical protein [Pseudomonas fluorescens group]|uniref:Uncharacterized protein n=2 Tax=Pseudomonas fluorescens TaxID=294 RepID=C3KD52_PSEFS|nr:MULTISPECIES: hypothetical protein [Pseudomonas fluorescens group]KJZ51343.1 hypothetical protein VC37_23685 [Pseudomonas marginalis]KJZ54840.1 hypothetical protein VC36_24260 [Pseudomonas marginalis]MBZ6457203.1 hypothetical protein [Pseudomonas fluorescens group sp.]MBZ6460410.1 hypothetical protein [Pseudomonas fluorescens group sp.]MBZ6466052.1 hypothetical protein [Pseudomonas fluorescens group sp.]